MFSTIVQSTSSTKYPFLLLQQLYSRMLQLVKAYYKRSIIVLSITFPIILRRAISLYPFNIIQLLLSFSSRIVVASLKALGQYPRVKEALYILTRAVINRLRLVYRYIKAKAFRISLGILLGLRVFLVAICLITIQVSYSVIGRVGSSLGYVQLYAMSLKSTYYCQGKKFFCSISTLLSSVRVSSPLLLRVSKYTCLISLRPFFY